ncbi:MAG: hypothetical protein AAFP22_04420 [Planctomycetota bacterium]
MRKTSHGTTGSGGLICHSLPLNIPFAPRLVQEGRHKGKTVICTTQERIEFAAAWNDSPFYVERYGRLAWDD